MGKLTVYEQKTAPDRLIINLKKDCTMHRI